MLDPTIYKPVIGNTCAYPNIPDFCTGYDLVRRSQITICPFYKPPTTSGYWKGWNLAKFIGEELWQINSGLVYNDSDQIAANPMESLIVYTYFSE